MLSERAAQILLEARTLDPDSRARYVSRVCAANTELAREVNALLVASDDSEAYFGKLAGKVGLEALIDDEEPDLTEVVVGSWKLLRRIGRGGMGAVYLAERADEQFEQQAALKLLPKNLDTRTARERFLNERQILARLVHDGIARLLDGGVTDEGAPYFVMDYVDGLPIDEFCAQRDLSLNERVALVLEIAEAVQFAHGSLVIHRDLKPSNILVTDAQRVRVLDFGIAKMLRPERADMTMTQELQRPATPAYASPEMLRGEPVDVTTDVYSIGVVLYVLLCDCVPVEYEGLSLAEMHERASSQEPLPASHFNPKLRGDIDAIVAKVLAKSPADRYPSVESLGNDLRNYLDGLPVAAKAPSAMYRFQKFVSRNRVGTAFFVFAIVSLATITGLAVRFAITSERQVAAIALERDRAEATKEFLISTFDAANPDVAPGDQTAREILEAGRSRIETELSEQPEIQGDLLAAMANVYVSWRLHEEGSALLERELELRAITAGERSAEYSDVLFRLAIVSDVAGDYETSRRYAERALEISEEIDDLLGQARGQERIGRIAHLLGEYDEAGVRYRRSLDLFLQAGEDGSMAKALVHDNLGNLMIHRERYEEALVEFEKSLDIKSQFVSGDGSELNGVYLGMGSALKSLGRYDEAYETYMDAYEMNERLFGPDNSYNMYSANGLGKVAQAMGDMDLAARRFDEARHLARLHTPDSPNLAFASANLARVHFVQERYDQALPLFREAEAIFSSKLPDHWMLGKVRWHLGRCLVEASEFAEAERLILSGRARVEEQWGADHPDTVEAAEAAAVLYERWGKPELAIAFRSQVNTAANPR